MRNPSRRSRPLASDDRAGPPSAGMKELTTSKPPSGSVLRSPLKPSLSISDAVSQLTVTSPELAEAVSETNSTARVCSALIKLNPENTPPTGAVNSGVDLWESLRHEERPAGGASPAPDPLSRAVPRRF